MIDLHTHSIFSDGELLPSELVRRGLIHGYTAIAITDHMDASNIDLVIPRIVKVAEGLRGKWDIEVIPGAEITHVPPSLIGELVKEARVLGARLVVLHGETIVEPVAPGTNRAGINAGVDIIAHPGMIAEEDVVLAKAKGIYLEITARKGHCLCNGHIAAMAKKIGVGVVINTDAHSPDDLITKERAREILTGSGLSDDLVEAVFNNANQLIERIRRGT